MNSEEGLRSCLPAERVRTKETPKCPKKGVHGADFICESVTLRCNPRVLRCNLGLHWCNSVLLAWFPKDVLFAPSPPRHFSESLWF